jgi:Pyruvate/2-oxoacid:ferredoxin oxidoreductase delta subunit
VPVKFHINTQPTPPRFRPEGKLGIVDWREDCASCKNCVKKGCVYGLYRDEADVLHEELGYLDYIYQCKGCLTCIQNCTKNILTRVENPEYKRLGDAYFTPDIVSTTWYQAETGAVPVSGCGYGGPFSGAGFDSMWTDMSEIVRPTRDGIHGREYINTGVDIGRKQARLVFDNMEMRTPVLPRLISPLPIMFDDLPKQWRHNPVVSAIVKAGANLGLYSMVSGDQVAAQRKAHRSHVVPLVNQDGSFAGESIADAPMVMVPDSDKTLDVIAALKKENPARLVGVRLTSGSEAHNRVLCLAQQGVEVVNLVFDKHGREIASNSPRHMRDAIRQAHGALVKACIRDEVTLVTSGGIGLPEHMAKAIICGADLVAVDVPLVIALECRLCGECERGEWCQMDLANIDEAYAVRRITNLMGSWHSQLLEMLGAMGIREARRLRGEVGRCMFFEDLEAAAFGRIFGKRKDQVQTV